MHVTACDVNSLIIISSINKYLEQRHVAFYKQEMVEPWTEILIHCWCMLCLL